MDEKKIKYILKGLYRMQGLFVQLYIDGKIFASPVNDARNYYEIFALGQYTADGYNGIGKYQRVNIADYYFYVLESREDMPVNMDIRLVAGPFTLIKKSLHEVKMFLNQYGIAVGELLIPVFSEEAVKEIIAYAHGLIFESYNFQKNDLFDSQDMGNDSVKQKLAANILENIEGEVQHYSYFREKQFYEYIITTLKHDINQLDIALVSDDFVDIKNGVGTLSKSEFKNAEYIIVGFVAILTRYAISAGTDESEAYDLSDVILRELSLVKNMDMFSVLLQRFISELGEMLQRSDRTHESAYIEEAKNYIARHIFTQIRLEDIANAVGVNPSYLSRKFSQETGTAIFDYIKRKKIDRSCNLLKYSDKSIAEIADYISLSPQSYYAKVFKQYMGITPSAYQRKYRGINLG